jgi:hypothetical protein
MISTTISARKTPPRRTHGGAGLCAAFCSLLLLGSDINVFCAGVVAPGVDAVESAGFAPLARILAAVVIGSAEIALPPNQCEHGLDVDCGTTAEFAIGSGGFGFSCGFDGAEFLGCFIFHVRGLVGEFAELGENSVGTLVAKSLVVEFSTGHVEEHFAESVDFSSFAVADFVDVLGGVVEIDAVLVASDPFVSDFLEAFNVGLSSVHGWLVSRYAFKLTHRSVYAREKVMKVQFF